LKGFKQNQKLITPYEFLTEPIISCKKKLRK